jgi:hypothetical protein
MRRRAASDPAPASITDGRQPRLPGDAACPGMLPPYGNGRPATQPGNPCRTASFARTAFPGRGGSGYDRSGTIAAAACGPGAPPCRFEYRLSLICANVVTGLPSGPGGIVGELDVGSFGELPGQQVPYWPAAHPAHRCGPQADGDGAVRREAADSARGQLLAPGDIGPRDLLVAGEGDVVVAIGCGQLTREDIGTDQGQAGAQAGKRRRAGNPPRTGRSATVSLGELQNPQALKLGREDVDSALYTVERAIASPAPRSALPSPAHRKPGTPRLMMLLNECRLGGADPPDLRGRWPTWT